MDSAGKYCKGCRRTSVEIGLWNRVSRQKTQCRHTKTWKRVR
ncbi:DUF1289 domain-containing protein [Cupriavidus sp. BIS7]|nr:DUF1289 domain-containing protein [Cupriavidus sp. BIS7]